MSRHPSGARIIPAQQHDPFRCSVSWLNQMSWIFETAGCSEQDSAYLGRSTKCSYLATPRPPRWWHIWMFRRYGAVHKFLNQTPDMFESVMLFSYSNTDSDSSDTNSTTFRVDLTNTSAKMKSLALRSVPLSLLSYSRRAVLLWFFLAEISVRSPRKVFISMI